MSNRVDIHCFSMHDSSMHERMGLVSSPRSVGLARSCLVAAVALAALDDITTGAEPDERRAPEGAQS